MPVGAASPLESSVSSSNTFSNISVGGSPGRPSQGGASNATTQPNLSLLVGPQDEFDFQTYLTTEQQTELVNLIGGNPGNPALQATAAEAPLPATAGGGDTSYPVSGSSLEADRSRAALNAALELGEAARLSELGYQTSLKNLRGVYYDTQRRGGDRAIRADYESRGVFESSDLDVARRDLQAQVAASQAYNDLQADWQFHRWITDASLTAADQTLRQQQGEVAAVDAAVRERIALEVDAAVAEPSAFVSGDSVTVEYGRPAVPSKF